MSTRYSYGFKSQFPVAFYYNKGKREEEAKNHFCVNREMGKEDGKLTEIITSH